MLPKICLEWNFYCPLKGRPFCVAKQKKGGCSSASQRLVFPHTFVFFMNPLPQIIQHLQNSLSPSHFKNKKISSLCSILKDASFSSESHLSTGCNLSIKLLVAQQLIFLDCVHLHVVSSLWLYVNLTDSWPRGSKLSFLISS